MGWFLPELVTACALQHLHWDRDVRELYSSPYSKQSHVVDVGIEQRDGELVWSRELRHRHGLQEPLLLERRDSKPLMSAPYPVQ